jgi:hypothetical protein
MRDLVEMASRSRARSALITLDCRFNGAAGNKLRLDSVWKQPSCARGVTILAASCPRQEADEVDAHGTFTDLVVGALKGGAADVCGRISAGAVYGYLESALGFLASRLLYKSHAAKLDPVRLCQPKVSDSLPRGMPIFFPMPDHPYRMEITYEETNQGVALPDHVAVFRKFKALQVVGPSNPQSAKISPLNRRAVRDRITHRIGQFYRRMSLDGHI